MIASNLLAFSTLLVGWLVYGLALWTYTLLPLPVPEEIRCAPKQLRPLQFIDEHAPVADREEGGVDELLDDRLDVSLAVVGQRPEVARCIGQQTS